MGYREILSEWIRGYVTVPIAGEFWIAYDCDLNSTVDVWSETGSVFVCLGRVELVWTPGKAVKWLLKVGRRVSRH